MLTLRELKINFEERFHDKWTSLSIQHHFKLMASHLTNMPFSQVNVNLSAIVTMEQSNQFQSWLTELAGDKPIQYILGETEFRDLRIFCTPSVLIPRPETEELVELIVNTPFESNSPKILDLCTGSACIAIALNKEISGSEVTGIDNFEVVLNLANKNNEENKTKVIFKKVNVLSEEEMLPFFNENFDAWVSNPPYIPLKDKTEMSANVLHFEPAEALFVSDEDPLIFYRRIAEDGLKGLKKGGKLFFEIHENFGQEIIALLERLDFTQIELHKDIHGKNRMISAQKK